MPRPPQPAGPGKTYAPVAMTIQSFARRVGLDEDPARKEWRAKVVEKANELVRLINEDTERVLSQSSRRAG